MNLASRTGWWNPNPFNARSKWHYVGEKGDTLCRKYWYTIGDIEEGKDDHKDNCAECTRKKQRMDEGGTAE